MRVETKVELLTAGEWKWPHVNPRTEWASRGSGELVYDTHFLDQFEKLRRMMGIALPINSGYRTPEHNQAVSTTGENGPHTTGRACDIRIAGAQAVALVHLALQLGFTGIGVSQKGPTEKRFIHLDNLTEADGFPRPRIWSY